MLAGVSVEVRNIQLAYGTTPVLKGISLAVEPGEFFGLLGPSGCGKSTLLRLIAGFGPAHTGQVFVGGREVSGIAPWNRNVGMVFQSYALWPHMTVAQNVAFGLEERRLPRAELRRRVADVLALVGLSELGARRPGQLSGGQQQRVALARTLVVEPGVLLLDEPLSNLDAKLRVHMRRELLSLQRKLGVTTIFVTHDQEEAMTTCSRIAVMDRGVVQQTGTPAELFDAPANRFVAEFVGSVNVVKGRMEGTRFTSALGALAVSGAKTGEASVAFRPHSVRLAAQPAADGRLWVAVQITDREFIGEFVRYHLAAAGADLIVDRPHLLGEPDFAPGMPVHAGIDPAQVQVLHD
jgi:iron(III) transport system ATP-binding protein